MKKNLALLLIIGFMNLAQGAPGDLSQTFTLEGELYDSPTGESPFLGRAEIQIRIFDPTLTCVLYAESQDIDTTTSSGIFNIEVGSAIGSPKRIAGADSNNSMALVYQNSTPIPATGATCTAPYDPTLVTGSKRFIQISITPDATGLTDVLSPEIHLGTVPSALTAQTLQGMTPADLATWIVGLIGGPVAVTTSATDTSVNAAGTGSLLFQTQGVTRAQIKNDGTVTAANRIGIGDSTPTFDLSFGGEVDRLLGIERRSSADTAGHALTVSSGGATTGATNKTGGDLYLASGASTGAAASSIFLQTATPGSSGTADNAPSTKVSVLGNGNVGIGKTPSTALDVNGGIRPGRATVVNQACDAASEGIERYDSATHFTQYCNGSAWTDVDTKLPGSTVTGPLVGAPVNSGTYPITGTALNYTPATGTPASTYNGTWPADGDSTASCLDLPEDGSRITYDLGANYVIGKIYFSGEGAYFHPYQMTFSLDGITYSTGTTHEAGPNFNARFNITTLNPSPTARYIRVVNGHPLTGKICQIAFGPP